MSNKQIILSSSPLYQNSEYLERNIVNLLKRNNVKTVLLIPFGVVNGDYSCYMKKVQIIFDKWGFQLEGIHNKLNAIESIQNAEAIFIGEGNVFLLMKYLNDLNLMDIIRKRILNDSIPYIGCGAGTVLAGRTIQTTNDMPIVFPGSFNALKLIPFHMNVHYFDTEFENLQNIEHREEQLLDFMIVNRKPCLSLRDGTALDINGNKAILIGSSNARLFRKEQTPIEYPPSTDFGFLFDKFMD